MSVSYYRDISIIMNIYFHTFQSELKVFEVSLNLAVTGKLIAA